MFQMLWKSEPLPYKKRSVYCIPWGIFKENLQFSSPTRYSESSKVRNMVPGKKVSATY